MLRGNLEADGTVEKKAKEGTFMLNMKTSHLLTTFGLVDLQDSVSNRARNQGCHLLLTQAVKVGTQQLEGLWHTEGTSPPAAHLGVP